MNVSPRFESAFPFDLHWSSQELADAVPLRLSELLDFDAGRDGAAACANGVARTAPPRRYACPAPLTTFRVR